MEIYYVIVFTDALTNVSIPKWRPDMTKLVLNPAWQIPLMTTKCGLMIGEFAIKLYTKQTCFVPLFSVYTREVPRSKSIKHEFLTEINLSKIRFLKFWFNCFKKSSENSIFYYSYVQMKICILEFLLSFLLKISGHLGACTKQTQNSAGRALSKREQ